DVLARRRIPAREGKSFRRGMSLPHHVENAGELTGKGIVGAVATARIDAIRFGPDRAGIDFSDRRYGGRCRGGEREQNRYCGERGACRKAFKYSSTHTH